MFRRYCFFAVPRKALVRRVGLTGVDAPQLAGWHSQRPPIRATRANMPRLLRPMFRFYPQDYLMKTHTLTLEEQAALMRLVAFCWTGSIRKSTLFDPAGMARLENGGVIMDHKPPRKRRLVVHYYSAVLRTRRRDQDPPASRCAGLFRLSRLAPKCRPGGSGTPGPTPASTVANPRRGT